MSQNHIRFNLTAPQITAIDAALAVLETELAGLLVIPPGNKRRMARLGDKSEAFCRQALRVLSENPNVVPPSLDVPEAVRELDARDQLKTRSLRLARLLTRMDDTAFALGSDAMNVATQGYTLLKVVGRDEGLHEFRQALSGRFLRSRRAAKQEKSAA